MDNEEILSLREQIDKTDDELCELLKKRFSLVKRIGAVKEKVGLSVCDKARESAVNERIAARFECAGEKEAAKNVYKTIIEQSKKLQLRSDKK